MIRREAYWDPSVRRTPQEAALRRFREWQEKYPLHLAGGDTLDKCGLYHRCPRESGEDDKSYRGRLLDAINRDLVCDLMRDLGKQRR